MSPTAGMGPMPHFFKQITDRPQHQVQRNKLIMKKAPNKKDTDEASKRKKMHTPSLGHFGWKLKKVIKGKEHASDVPDGKPTQRHQCDARKA